MRMYGRENSDVVKLTNAVSAIRNTLNGSTKNCRSRTSSGPSRMTRAVSAAAATSATYGMPMVVELGIALDVLVGVLILGVFFFQIREQFDSLDLKHLENLREGE